MSRRRRGADHALDDPRVRGMLAGAELLYSAVKAKRGPHLTPTAVSWEADRLWAVAPKDSVKVRTLRRDPRLGLLISDGDGADGRHLVGTGVVRLYDPLDLPTSYRVGELLRAPFGAARYLAENTRHAVGVVLDDPNPFALVDRVVLSVDLRRVALVQDDAVVDAWGDWPRASLLGPPDPVSGGPLVLPDRTPAWAARLLTRDRRVQIGWRSVDGPLALPATWSADGDAATTSADLLALAGALPEGPACLTSARNSYRMNDKIGILLRGEGRATLTGDGTARVTLAPTRVTHWRGKTARTLPTASTTGTSRPGTGGTDPSSTGTGGADPSSTDPSSPDPSSPDPSSPDPSSTGTTSGAHA
jgi:hypothetical protein